MREAIGSSLLFNIVLVIVIIMVAFLVGSLSYSKAFKVKNKIVDIIEKNNKYDAGISNEINEVLSNVGYKKTVSNSNPCPKIKINNKNYTSIVDFGSYEYCVYKISTIEGNSYYKVITYMYFDIPVIGQLLKFPVSGETKVMYDTYINYE